MADRFYLTRFKNAQENGGDADGKGTFAQALQEVKKGKKMGHWIWYIFPQPRGFGHTHKTWFYGVTSLEEAKAYLEDEILGTRLREISQAVLDQPTTDVKQLMGDPDWLKLGACMTLFDYISPNDVFAKVIDKFYAGSRHNEAMHMIYTKKSFN